MTGRKSAATMRAPELREHGLTLAMRFVAVLRMGRSYAIGNPAFTGQLEQMLEVLRPVLRACGEARLTQYDGELRLNDEPLPLRQASARFTEQLAHELELRGIAGVRFMPALTVPELELFMRYFLPSEVYRGPDLERACATQGIVHAVPLPAEAEAPRGAEAEREAPPAYRRALEACARARHDAEWLIGGALPRGVSMHRYERIVQPLVDSALAGDPLSAGLADLDEAGDACWMRGVHVALLAILAGRALGLQRDELAVIGVAALIHGADGMAAPAGIDPASFALLRRARLAPLDPPLLTAMRAALPARVGVDPATPAAELVRAAETYVALATRRADGLPMRTPHDALGEITGPRAERFHAALRTALVRALGVYPPGQIVELDDGTVARVCAAHPGDPRRPLVERLTGPAAARLEGTERGRVAPLPDERRIVRAVPYTRPGSSGDTRAA